MRSHLTVFLLLPVLALASSPPSDKGRVVEIRKSVIRITNSIQLPDYKAPWNPGGLSKARGTGFIIAGKRILTNAHVVSNSRYLTVERDGDPNLYPARVAFIGHDCDLAVLDVEDPHFFEGLPALELDKLPEIESTVSVFGYPIGGEHLSVTRGVVSRIDFQVYSHSGVDSHLAVQIDAAINPGNSGGPVLQNDKVVGVAFQGYSGAVAQNVGYMIPVPVIRRFLKDIEDGHYDRYVDLGISYFSLLNPAQRRALGLKNNNRGVYVSTVIRTGSCDGLVREGDVLLGIDAYPVGSDGLVWLDKEQVELSEIVERKLKGEDVSLLLWRGGEEISVRVALKPLDVNLMQGNTYDERPCYVEYAGLVFQPLSRNYINAYGAGGLRLRYYFDQYINESLFLEHPEIVVLSDVLADPVNSYLGGYRQSIVSKVDGKAVKTLRDLSALLAAPAPVHVIEMEGEGRPVVLETKEVENARTRIRQRYHIPEEQYLGN